VRAARSCRARFLRRCACAQLPLSLGQRHIDRYIHDDPRG
jgi:hypothetical protein